MHPSRIQDEDEDANVWASERQREKQEKRREKDRQTNVPTFRRPEGQSRVRTEIPDGMVEFGSISYFHPGPQLRTLSITQSTHIWTVESFSRVFIFFLLLFLQLSRMLCLSLSILLNYIFILEYFTLHLFCVFSVASSHEYHLCSSRFSYLLTVSHFSLFTLFTINCMCMSFHLTDSSQLLGPASNGLRLATAGNSWGN